jgi:hypothetical protein
MAARTPSSVANAMSNQVGINDPPDQYTDSDHGSPHYRAKQARKQEGLDSDLLVSLQDRGLPSVVGLLAVMRYHRCLPIHIHCWGCRQCRASVAHLDTSDLNKQIQLGPASWALDANVVLH